MMLRIMRGGYPAASGAEDAGLLGRARGNAVHPRQLLRGAGMRLGSTTSDRFHPRVISALMDEELLAGLLAPWSSVFPLDAPRPPDSCRPLCAGFGRVRCD